jgi:hypothetical protein
VHLVVKKAMALDWEGSLLLDANQRVQTHYGIRVPSLVFIRPDGYIGIVCPLIQESKLIKYLKGIYLLPCKEGTAAEFRSSVATGKGGLSNE